MDIAKPSLVYRHQTGLYVNLTNRCPTACVFCIKHKWKMKYRGSDLNLSGAEPDAGTLLELIRTQWAQATFKELVFCGYGEPTVRLGTLLEVAGAVKSGGLSPLPAGLRVRMNTNGLGTLVNGRNIVPELKGILDAVHVSLNTADPDQWLAMMRPVPEYAEKGFEGVLEFIRGCAGAIPETVATTIRSNSVDFKKFEALAERLGAGHRLRDGLV